MRGQREARGYPQELHGFATFSMLVKPLCQCRARHGLFTCVALGRPVSSPNSRPSLCLQRSGLRGVALALSVATYPGWLRSWERNTKFSDRESWRFLEHKCSASCSWAALSGIGCRPKPKKPHGAFASVNRTRAPAAEAAAGLVVVVAPGNWPAAGVSLRHVPLHRQTGTVLGLVCTEKTSRDLRLGIESATQSPPRATP